MKLFALLVTLVFTVNAQAGLVCDIEMWTTHEVNSPFSKCFEELDNYSSSEDQNFSCDLRVHGDVDAAILTCEGSRCDEIDGVDADEDCYQDISKEMI